MPVRMLKKMGMTWNCMEHTSFWSMLVILL